MHRFPYLGPLATSSVHKIHRNNLTPHTIHSTSSHSSKSLRISTTVSRNMSIILQTHETVPSMADDTIAWVHPKSKMSLSGGLDKIDR